MKQTAGAILIASALALYIAPATAGFGPDGCVSVETSAKGTCVMRTDCGPRDLSQVEFAIDCEAAEGGTWIRHSFGRGGFEPKEDFDTEIQCKTCAEPMSEAAQANDPAAPSTPQQLPPQPAPAEPRAAPTREQAPAAIQALASHSQAASQRSAAQSKSTWFFNSEESLPVYYGPSDCVSTFKGMEGTCVLKTDCAAEDIQDYMFGLVCVSKNGIPIRHLFGKNSFDPKETFDTLIACEQCLGLSEIPREIMINGQIHLLSSEVTKLEAVLGNLTQKVDMLLPSASPSPMPSPSPAPMTASTTAAPVNMAVSHHRRSLRGGHRVARRQVRQRSAAAAVRRHLRRQAAPRQSENDEEEATVPNAHRHQHVRKIVFSRAGLRFQSRAAGNDEVDDRDAEQQGDAELRVESRAAGNDEVVDRDAEQQGNNEAESDGDGDFDF